MNLANLKIRTKLALGFGIVLLLLVVLTAMAVNGMSRLRQSNEKIVTEEWEKTKATITVLDNLRGSIARVFQLATAADPTQQGKARERLTANQQAYRDALKRLDGMLVTENGRKLLAEAKAAGAAYDEKIAEVDKLLGAGSIDEARLLAFGPAYDALQAFAKEARDLFEYLQKNLEEAGRHSNETYVTARNASLILGVLAILFGAMAAFLVSRAITAPLSRAVRFAETVAEGDLRASIQVDSRDETGQLLVALGAMNENLVKIVSQVRMGTDTMSTAANEIATGNLDLSARTEQQAGALEETASSMEELTSTVKQNADNSRQANQLAISAAEVAMRGGAVVAQVVETMGAINDSSRRVVDIIAVIDGIAFQTNILALNAAVEAARAGEQGRGFAVVAAEVRNLAQRSASAAKEIKQLIADSVERVDTGSRLVDQAGTTMEEVVASIRRVTDIMAEITAASEEQRSGIEQVNKAITQIDTTTQQNAALVEQAAAAAQSMTEQASHLSNVVSVFKLDFGNTAMRPPRLAS